MKLTIERINHYDKNSQGEPYTGKYGAYSICRILTTIEGEKKTISGIDDKNKITKGWKDGDEIEVSIEKKGDYLNFRLPDQRISRQEFDLLKQKVKFLEDEVGFLHKKFEGLELENKVEELEKEVEAI